MYTRTDDVRLEREIRKLRQEIEQINHILKKVVGHLEDEEDAAIEGEGEHS